MGSLLFKQISFDVEYLVSAISEGLIGLPDLQRPFVWSFSKVRDLFDSMFRGYPVGHLILWSSPGDNGYKKIGENYNNPDTLIIDGQQRLTSLYAVMKSKKVFKNFKWQHIIIAFHPRTGEFAVSTAAHKKDPEWIENISEYFKHDYKAFALIGGFISNLRSHRNISPNDEEVIARNIEKLLSLKKYPFSALEIYEDADEENVAEIFVRVNSQGQKLNQADFILTLMSVFWEEGREALEDFCSKSRRPSSSQVSPFNHFIQPDPDQLLRVAVGYGFRRARLKYVYLLLRGKDLETGEVTPERRVHQFELLHKAQEKVINIQNWHDFLKVPLAAGYRHSGMITSKTALIYAYVFYLIGKYDYGIDSHILRKLIARWFFMSSLTGRYSASPETRMEQDLADLRNVRDADHFIAYIKEVISSVLTRDFWSITLPRDLATAVARSPAWFAYCAALNLLDARVLFSNMKVSQLLDPASQGLKAAVERHHLFPKAYLASTGIELDRDRNQIANFALVEWDDNIKIADKAPYEYLPIYLSRFSESEIRQMYYWHALPEKWERMNYPEFLEERRKRMAAVIKGGFEVI